MGSIAQINQSARELTNANATETKQKMIKEDYFLFETKTNKVNPIENNIFFNSIQFFF